ncbi:Methyltransferase [Klebsormidium nitens]|uniref:Methyltransferase n=1 Tax=Klebsormidium nitens TaxID=105231 RepID=A0A1Y1IC86_KLENI|nr:Methyltransferase [Klebsormidium nitens]|eukprot:GAQ88193.1 Methyltransferase [Klebsormidium nitens]
MATRPEQLAPPEVFYNDTEARKYTTSSRMVEIQANLTERALELLNLPEDGEPKLLLDLGCGSGLSGESLTECGHHWLGMDISEAMLDVACEREVEGDVMLSDIGQGLPLRTGVFDGAISISAIQWLCNADKTANDPRQRLKAFFQTLYRSLARGARAVLQFYPDGPKQVEMISSAAMRVGFSGGLVVDFPHSTRAKKYFLVLMAGPPSVNSTLPKAKGVDGGSESNEDDVSEDDEGATVEFADRQRHAKRRRKDGKRGKGRSWILNKKRQQREKGVEVPADTKYTGRKRKARF